MADVAIPARFEIETRDIEFLRHGDTPLLARLYRPKGEGPFPALIDVHGGAWASGDRLNNAPLDEALAKSGITVLAIDFRMPPAHRYPKSIADINFAIRWLKAHAREFGSRRELVSALGTSSGGHQLLLAALKPDDPRYASIPLAEAPGEDARLPYIVLCWPISDPLARYRMVREKGNNRLVEAHDAWWASEAEMEEGNPLADPRTRRGGDAAAAGDRRAGHRRRQRDPGHGRPFRVRLPGARRPARPAQIRRPAAHLYRARPGQRGLASGDRKAARFRAATGRAGGWALTPLSSA